MTGYVLLLGTGPLLKEPVRTVAIDIRVQPGELLGTMVETLEKAYLTSLATVQEIQLAALIDDGDEQAVSSL